MQLRRIKFEIYSVLLVISLGILVHSVSEAEINLTTSGLRVTDVNTTAFSLVWVANQAATSFANVYEDPNGNQPIAGLTIKDESFDHPPAGQDGVMKVRVSGLTKNTTYYFRIVTTSNEGVLIEPASGALPSVRTEDRTVVGYNNGVLAHKVLKGDGTTHAESALVLAEIQGGSYPITAWVGVSSHLPEWAFLELDNFYDPESHRSLELMGGEPVTLTSIGGSIGFRRLSGWLPQQLGGLPFTLDPEPEYPDDCILDLAGPVIDTQQIQPDSGAFINDNTPFITAAYTDHYSDIDLASVKLLVDSVDVTDQATVDSQKVEYAPTSPLSAGSHDVTLEVADEWGNEADPFSWSFTVDSTVPTATIVYSTTEPTNLNVVATLETSEPVTVTNNSGLLTYTFTDNGTFTFEFMDAAGNTGSATATVSNIDRIAPSVFITYGGPNSSHVDAGTLTITATFSESLITSPQIAIDRPDPMSTIGPGNMSGSDSVWTYDVTIETHNDTTVIDGVNMVVISNAIDLAGNTAAEDFTSIFTTDTKDTDGDGERDYLDPDDDNDSLPDTWEEAYGLDPLDGNGTNGNTGDFDNDGWSNFEEYVNGTDPADDAFPAPTPPEIIEVIPQSDTNTLIPKNTSFAVLIEDSDGIDITETGSIKFTVDDQQNMVYERDLHTNGEAVRVVKLSDDDDTRVTRLWVLYDRSCEVALGDYPWGAAVNIKVDAKDRRQDWREQTSHNFRIETETEHSDTGLHLPDTEPVDSTDPALEGVYDEGRQVINGGLQGAKVIYNSSEPVPPSFGPLDEIPPVNVDDGEAVGIALNFQPPTVFNTPVKIFIPCPGHADVSSLSVYYYNGTNWKLACDAIGNVQPQAAGWMVPGSRMNHNNGGPSAIEIKVYHFSGAQAASNGSSESGGPQIASSGGGGGGGGCFIATAAF